MAATGVTFQIYTISTAGVETASTILPVIYAKDIATGGVAVKIAKAIPGRREYYFPKGEEAPTVKIMTRLYGSGIPGKTDQATAWLNKDPTGGLFDNALLKVTNTEYIELPLNSYWWLDSHPSKRSGGPYNIFEMEINLRRSYYSVTDYARAT